MKRQTLLIIGIILAVGALVFFVFKDQLATENKPEPSVQQTTSEADNLLNLNTAALGASIDQKIPAISASDNLQGSLEAPVKIVVYENWNDAYFVDLDKTLKNIWRDFPNQVVIAYRFYNADNNNLTNFVNGYCAGQQGKFLEMRQGILEHLKVSGLKASEFDKCVNDEATKNIIVSEMDKARGKTVFGAPTTFVDDEIVIGARPYEDYTDKDGQKIEGFKSIINRHLTD